MLRSIIALGMAASMAHAQRKNYCATFKSEEAGGAKGYFQMTLGNGTATYSYYLDLSGITYPCDKSGGLLYHIHGYWFNETQESNIFPYCGFKYCGYHYDPFLGCSRNSEDTDGLCINVSRTTSSNPPYQYSCTPENYTKGHYALCEVGDLVGKFGRPQESVPGNNIYQQLTPLIDYFPPVMANYQQEDMNSYPWASVMFHCKDEKPIVCAHLIEDAVCDTSISSSETNTESNDENEWAVGEWNSLSQLVLGLVLGFLVLGGVFYAGYFYRGQQQNEKSKLMEFKQTGASKSSA